MRETSSLVLAIIASVYFSSCQGDLVTPEMDEFRYDGNVLKIYFFGHASLMLDFNGTIIHIDPVKTNAAYETKPKADLIMVTHEHGDHLDIDTIGKLTGDKTVLLVTQAVFDKIKLGVIFQNSQSRTFDGIKITAVPAYNTSLERAKYHPRGAGNGYIIELGKKRIYIAGDTEDIPEMAGFGPIDIAFLPMNLPYTMSVEQVARAAEILRPRILYPYHFGDTDVTKLQDLVKGFQGMELRVKDLK